MQNDLSDNQRRFICRVLFLFACALPTIAIVYFASHQRTADQWSQLVQAELGVETSIGGVESPRPGEFLFQDVKLFDNDGQRIFESLKARVTLGDINLIEFQNPVRMTRQGMSHFLEEAATRLIKPQPDGKLWEVNFNSIEIISKGASEYEYASFNMNRLEVRLSNGRQGPVVKLEALLAGKSGERSEDWGRLQFEKNSTGVFEIKLDTTQDGAVPCWLAKHWFPSLELLGVDAHFSGEIAIDTIARISSCELTGDFTRIKLPPLRDIPASVVSSARSLHVNRLELNDSQWINGKAAICLNDNRYLELPSPNILLPKPQPTELVTEAIRNALREDLEATAQHY